MAADATMKGDAPERRHALDDHEFSIVRRGYDPDEVTAFLADIEVNLRQLEEWAELMKARLSLAEEKSAAIDDVDQAMLAVFEARERVLYRAERLAEQIEADAIERGRVDAEALASQRLAEAQEEARLIVEEAKDSVAPVTAESILIAARREADRMIENARLDAERITAEAPAEPVAPHATVRSEAVSQLLVAMESGELEIEERSDEESPADETNEAKRSRYERHSASLPSIGDDASAVLGSIERIRDKFRDS